MHASKCTRRNSVRIRATGMSSSTYWYLPQPSLACIAFICNLAKNSRRRGKRPQASVLFQERKRDFAQSESASAFSKAGGLSLTGSPKRLRSLVSTSTLFHPTTESLLQDPRAALRWRTFPSSHLSGGGVERGAPKLKGRRGEQTRWCASLHLPQVTSRFHTYTTRTQPEIPVQPGQPRPTIDYPLPRLPRQHLHHNKTGGSSCKCCLHKYITARLLSRIVLTC